MFGIGQLRWSTYAADTAAITAEMHVIDIGAGRGTAAREAARRGATVAAVDPSPAARSLNRLMTRRALRSQIQSIPAPPSLCHATTTAVEAQPIREDQA
jgi:cyclopropane fatty-acyl-phospholipid synthase-like methyltransferase